MPELEDAVDKKFFSARGINSICSHRTDDGLCAIDLGLKPLNENQEISTWREVWLAANSLIHLCAQGRPPHEGGYVTGLGTLPPNSLSRIPQQSFAGKQFLSFFAWSYECLNYSL